MINAAILGAICVLAVLAFQLGRRQAAAAFAIIAIGVAVTWAVPGRHEGVVGFGVWTLIAGALVARFPMAALLFLASGLCYVMDSNAALAYGLQVAANVLGMAGLVYVWIGGKRLDHGGSRRFALDRRGLAVGFHSARSAAPDEGTRP